MRASRGEGVCLKTSSCLKGMKIGTQDGNDSSNVQRMFEDPEQRAVVGCVETNGDKDKTHALDPQCLKHPERRALKLSGWPLTAIAPLPRAVSCGFLIVPHMSLK